MLQIYGASDDLVELEGIVVDEIGCYGKGVRIYVGEGDTKSGGVVVTMRYGRRAGVWSAEIEPWDEDIHIPWRTEVSLNERGYSALVTIACPSGTHVRAVKLSRKKT